MDRFKKHAKNKSTQGMGTGNKSSNNLIKELFEGVLNSLPEGIWIYDADGKLLMINHAAELLEGLKAKEVVGKTYHEIFKAGLFDSMVAPDVFASKKEASILSYTHRTKKQLLITGKPIFHENGQIALVINVLRDMTELIKTQEQLKESQKETKKIKDTLVELNLLELKDKEIIAESDSMRRVLSFSIKLAAIDAGVILVLGESGTGKGLISKFIHNSSKREKKSFIQINCAALPENLLEAELFGYESGAFTGASRDGKVGLLELADKGTLFLDEIGDLPLSLQAKLLKFLEDYEVMRLGGVRRKRIDCTIIAATNCDLKAMIKKKLFRQDLFYRLEGFTIKIPPLRKRSEDVFELTNYFLKKYNKKYKKKTKISSKAMMKLNQSYLPGNVRQLENALKMAIAMSDDENIDQLILQKLDQPQADTTLSLLGGSEEKSLKERMLEIEKKILKDAKTKYKTTRLVASHLRLSKSTAARRLKKYGLS